MSKKVYIVINYDNDYAKAIKLTEEQKKAIDWFIDLADLNYGCELPDDSCVEEIE